MPELDTEEWRKYIKYIDTDAMNKTLSGQLRSMFTPLTDIPVGTSFPDLLSSL